MIVICTLLCSLIFKKKCTGKHIISSRPKHRSLCRVELLWGESGWICCSSELNLLSLSLSKCNKFKKLHFMKVNKGNLPNFPSRKVNSTQWPMFRSAKINNKSFQILYLNKIKEIWGCILEALIKNLYLFILQFWVFDEI